MPKAGEVIVPFDASIVTEQPEEYLKKQSKSPKR